MTALLEVRGVSKRFPIGGVLSGRDVRAVTNVNFGVGESGPEIFTIIGESGSGKTTLTRMILGLERPTTGQIVFDGRPVRPDNRQDRLAFMSKVQPVFQNPFEAFNPLRRVDQYLASTVTRFLRLKEKAEIEAAMDGALQNVGLSLAEVGGRFPHELSGGQLQRAAIARALIPNPALLIADEPVSMVDASLRMSIINVLRHLRDQMNVCVIYVTHDLATAYYISDRLMIMQRGLVVEMGPARAVLENPQHPYSRLLKASVLSDADAGGDRLHPAADLIEMSQENVGMIGTMVSQADGRQVRQYA